MGDSKQYLSRTAFLAALDVDCPDGHGVAKHPCWVLRGDGRPHLALCSSRVTASLKEIHRG